MTKKSKQKQLLLLKIMFKDGKLNTTVGDIGKLNEPELWALYSMLQRMSHVLAHSLAQGELENIENMNENRPIEKTLRGYA